MRTAFITSVLLTSNALALDWPSAACSGTLQACINSAASGETIEIVTEATIDESISWSNKSLTLRADGVAARFAPGRTLSVFATQDGNQITLENLWWQDDVQVVVGSNNAAHNQSVTIRGLRVDTTGTLGMQISRASGALSNYTLVLDRSVIHARAIAATALRLLLNSAGGTPSVSISNNQINSGRNGIDLRMGANGGNVFLNANRIVGTNGYMTPATGEGSFGIAIQGLGGGPTATTTGVQRNVVISHPIGIIVSSADAQVNARILNNSVLQSNQAIVLSGVAASPLSGRVANNLIDRAVSCGLFYTSPATITATADYNLYSNTPTPRCDAPTGSNDVVGNARIRSPFDARLNTGSAAIDRGSNADQPQTFLIVPIATPDHDGKAGRVGGQVDIGAFERSFETSFVHNSSSGNIIGNRTEIDDPPFSLLIDDMLQIGQYGREINGVSTLPAGSANHIGSWFSTTRWTIFGQNQAPGSVSVGRRFYTLLNITSNTNLLHVATAANTSFNVSTLDHPLLNNRPDAIPIVTQRWDPDNDGTGTYNNNAIGVWYNPSVNRWTIFNQQPTGGPISSMPVDSAFNVMIANPLFATGSHAFRATSPAVPVSIFNLDHPLLNNNACAHPYVTASYNPNNVYVPSNVLVSYNPSTAGRGAWAIERGDGQQIPAGAAFHVYIDPAQSKQCQEDVIFNDGFQDL
jgi:hypothetical protein